MTTKMDQPDEDGEHEKSAERSPEIQDRITNKYGMTMRRFREILRAERDGNPLELNEDEQAAYDKAKKSATELTTGVSAALTPVSGQSQLTELMKSVAKQQSIANAALNKSIASYPKVDHLEFTSPTLDYPSLDHFASVARNNREKREAAEERDKLQRLQTELLQKLCETTDGDAAATRAIAATLAEQEVATEVMSRHQRRMNWLILCATIVGIAVAIILGVFFRG